MKVEVEVMPSLAKIFIRLFYEIFVVKWRQTVIISKDYHTELLQLRIVAHKIQSVRIDLPAATEQHRLVAHRSKPFMW
jgi:hypothetical protein